MKRMWICFVVIVLLLSFVSCENPEKEEREYYVRKDNELYSDEHRNPEYRRRTYDMSYIIGDSPNIQKVKNKPLSEMKRFVFAESSIHNDPSDMLYVLDMHSNRVYCGEGWNINVYFCEWIVNLQQSDVDRLVAKLAALDVQNWNEKKKNSDSGREYMIGIEFEDGTIENHFIKGEDTNITELLNYFKAERETFKNRMLQDRKTTENIDYLVSYLGWDPSKDKTELQPIVFDDIDRIVIFEAEGPHEVFDHSRSKQKTLFLDVVNGKLYYEAEKTVYEQIQKASVVRELEAGEAENVISLLAGGVSGWKANEIYITDEEAVLKLSYADIPAWSIGIQYKDGTIVHYSGDGIGENGWAPGSRELLDALFGSIQY